MRWRATKVNRVSAAASAGKKPSTPRSGRERSVADRGGTGVVRSGRRCPCVEATCVGAYIHGLHSRWRFFKRPTGAQSGGSPMAGHSKWKQIKHKKALTDNRRAATWTKKIREITVAAKEGGGDPAGNPRLRLAIDTAKSVNMPNENIDRAIKKGTGELEGVNYEEITYEAYGPAGVAILIESLTDNGNRTVADIRRWLSRNGGNLGSSGSVAWMFDRRGQIYIDSAKHDEET